MDEDNETQALADLGLAAALDAAGLRSCPSCGNVLRPRFAELSLSSSRVLPAVKWVCDGLRGFHWSRTDPLKKYLP